ncbi:hypothetical protein OHA28_12255 [Streptomyces sp. NBC_00269]|nr:hypothetical protein [Streptomyces sp. NBC_00269]
MCGFDMFMHTWSQEIAGTRPDLIRSEVENAGIPTETDRNVAHLESLKIVESRFHLNLPKELVLYGELPAALIAGQS